jgi:hypothetical protein
MSAVTGTDLILVEAAATVSSRTAGVVYKCSKTDWDTSVTAAGSGAASTYGLAIQTGQGMNTYGYNASGYVKQGYSPNSMKYTRSDASGAYGLSDTHAINFNYKPDTRVKIGGTYYPLDIGEEIPTAGTWPSPINQYYKRIGCSWLYTAAQMDTAISAASGAIQEISIYCHTAPSGNYNNLPTFKIGLKLVPASAGDDDNYSGTTGGSYTEVFSTSNYQWTSASWNNFTCSSSITWS